MKTIKRLFNEFICYLTGDLTEKQCEEKEIRFLEFESRLRTNGPNKEDWKAIDSCVWDQINDSVWTQIQR